MRNLMPVLLAAAAFACAAGAQAANVSSSRVQDLSKSTAGDPPMLGIVRPHDSSLGRRGGDAGSPQMIYHGGKIMTTVVSKSIFWGPSWVSPRFVGDKISGLDSWYEGHNNSNYAATVNEYTGTNGQVSSSGFVHQGHVIDTSQSQGGARTSAILREVCSEIASGAITPDMTGNGYYPVYTDQKRGAAGYCAWHSAGNCVYHGQVVPVQFAFFWNLDGDSGCDPQDDQTGHSQGLAALANVTAHEFSEARSDPASPGAWYDSSDQENGDKCAWTFDVPYVSFPNGTIWKLQGEWSNDAYTNGYGYPNSSGQAGCLSGY